MKTIQLNQKNLKYISEQIQCPSYNREQVRCGIVHIGVGGFHRSHEAFYTDELLEKFHAREWGICGIGLREADRKIAEVFERQDCLYTLISKSPKGDTESRVIGSINEFILAVDQPRQAIQKMAHVDTKIVSLTITEGGYNTKASGKFDFNNADVQHDLKHPENPKTVFGFLAAALKKRQEDQLPAFTLMSCDNVEHNGDVAKYVLLAFVEKQDPELAGWIKENVCFPNSMVDRITPVTTQQDIDYLSDSYGVKDEWPVTCEPFIQWVIEDTFSNGRPAFEMVGVHFVPDVTPYEKMKLRLLNAGHSVLGLPGAIYGHPTINACMDDTVFASFMRKFMDEEATPVLDPVAGIDLKKYKNTLEERFSNPNIKDSVARICSESSAKLPKFLIPTLQENIQNGGSIRYATLVLAAWCYYSDRQVNRNNEPLEIMDAMQEQLHEAARGTSQDVLSFLRLDEIFGDLIDKQSFTKLYTKLVKQIYDEPDISKHMVSMMNDDIPQKTQN
ncbi:mannitol 2-dehydrogenase [Catalinimonas alkaloidigena]|uniref:mannitol dehydrogenase family protein n=1 Tax=Catalinimonas alkaloidigena TaxID=1075417 RepID=UPI002406FDD7|nr:mannitol dehydrogenase family protein [Catalinimonas alkaloidigena]MDF9800765.1 mannitol 2-dehydrogenase [Catalinimonas alkaloidigena]